MLAGLPVAKLSRQRTVCPSRRKCSQRLEPMNPAPPVISSFIFGSEWVSQRTFRYLNANVQILEELGTEARVTHDETVA